MGGVEERLAASSVHSQIQIWSEGVNVIQSWHVLATHVRGEEAKVAEKNKGILSTMHSHGDDCSSALDPVWTQGMCWRAEQGEAKLKVQ